MAGHIPDRLETDLRAFLHQGAAKKFDWISCNCGFWVCEWIERRTGIDPVRDMRKRFDDAFAFQRFVLVRGGNEAFSRGIAERAGLSETGAPQRGDVGLVQTGAGAAMAICIGDGRWAAKSMHGVVIAEMPVITAWSI